MAIEAIDALTDAHFEDLLELYRQAWWCRDRRSEDVRRMLKHTDALVGFCETETGKLVGFARILTDFVYKAVIFDVIVAESHRGQNIGRSLMEAILEHPSVRAVEHVESTASIVGWNLLTEWNTSACPLVAVRQESRLSSQAV